MDCQTRVEHTLGLAALVQALVKELRRALRRRQEAVALPVRDARREQVAGRPPRARGRAGRPARRPSACRPASSPGGSSTRVRPHAEDLGSAERARRPRGHARQRQRRRPAGGRLRGQPRPARGRAARSSRRPSPEGRPRRSVARWRCLRRVPRDVRVAARPLRRLQELRVRGQPVRHRVPVLRAAGAQARAEDRSQAGRRSPSASAAPRAKPPSLPRLRRDEIPGIAPDTRPYATGSLIIIALAAWVTVATSHRDAVGPRGRLLRPVSGEWWRVVATPFAPQQRRLPVRRAGGGRHLRHAARAPLRLARPGDRVPAGGRGWRRAGRSCLDPDQAALGANGAALGLLCAWLVDDRLAPAAGTTATTT